MIKIDKNCVYVPSEYIGKVIVIRDVDGDPEDWRSTDGKVVSCHKGGGWVNHRGGAEIGRTYEICQWSPREHIGTVTYGKSAANETSYRESSGNSNHNQQRHKSWWEFGHQNESCLASLFLLPFRLVINPVVFVLQLTVEIISFIISIPIFIISFFLKLIASIVVLYISIVILLPLKVFLLIITLGFYNGFENRFIDKLDDIWNS